MPSLRNRWRIAFFVLLAIWITSVGVFGYEIVDQAVTISYGQDSYDAAEHALTILKRLTPAIQGRSQRLADAELRSVVDDLTGFVRRAVGEVHTYVRFVGD